MDAESAYRLATAILSKENPLPLLASFSPAELAAAQDLAHNMTGDYLSCDVYMVVREAFASRLMSTDTPTPTPMASNAFHVSRKPIMERV